MIKAAEADPAAVWILSGGRPGEVTQQRSLAAAIGRPVREVQIAQLQPSGGKARIDLQRCQPPWPTLAISFGKTLPAALKLRAASGGLTRVVHLGRPRGVQIADLDLLIPMPQDCIDEASNVVRIRMPLNPAPAYPSLLGKQALSAAGLPQPITTLIIGGRTRQHRFELSALIRLLRAVSRRVRLRGGSLLVSTSPRTPRDATAALAAAVDVPGKFYAFEPDDPGNPLSTYLHAADELIVTGDSASMVAECWRTGKPLLVAPVGYSLMHLARSAVRRAAPRALVERGYVSARVDINGWLEVLAAEGHIGLFGTSEPSRPYAAADDDDLARVIRRIRQLL